MLGTILIVFLILALLGAFPRWEYSRDWGYWPSGGVGLALLIVVILVLMGASNRHARGIASRNLCNPVLLVSKLLASHNWDVWK
jgi:Protein of unknown function (DUF3309)